MPSDSISWPHAPSHQLSQAGTYFVTGSTYLKQHYFRGPKRLSVVQRGLLRLLAESGWHVEAWAVFSNHYHFVAHSPADQTDAHSLKSILTELHSKTAIWVNRLDHAAGRQVWFNYRETLLTHQRSYLTRLNYVHQNAVKHGLVPVAHLYPWCSATWFEQTASPAQVRSIYRFKTDRVKVADDFKPDEDW